MAHRANTQNVAQRLNEGLMQTNWGPILGAPAVRPRGPVCLVQVDAARQATRYNERADWPRWDSNPHPGGANPQFYPLEIRGL